MTSPTPHATMSRALGLVRTYGLVALAAAAPLSSWARLGPVTAADVLLALLAATGLAEILMLKTPWRHALPPVGAFALLVVGAASGIAALGNGHVTAIVKELVQLSQVVIVGYAYVFFAARDRRVTDRALIAFAAAFTIHVLLAWIQLFGWEHAFLVRGLTDHRNAFGALAAVACPVLVCVGLAPRRHAALRAWYLLIAVLALFTLTSGGAAAAAVGGILVGASATGWRRGAIALAAVALVALVAQPLALPRVRAAQLRSVSFLPEDESGRRAPSARIRRWQAGMNALADYPALGVGPGQFQKRISEYYFPPFDKLHGSSDDIPGFDVRFDEPGTQCLYEVTAVETGLFGLLALGAFFAGVIARLARRVPVDASGVAAGALGVVAAVLVLGVFTTPLVRGVALTLVLVLALGDASGGDVCAGDRQ